jgi:hypothetical protein
LHGMAAVEALDQRQARLLGKNGQPAGGGGQCRRNELDRQRPRPSR